MKRRLLLRESCEIPAEVVETVPLEVFKSWNTICFPVRGPRHRGGGFRTSLRRQARAQRPAQGLGQGAQGRPCRGGVRRSGSRNHGDDGGRVLSESPQAVCFLICPITACWLGPVSGSACREGAPCGP